MQLYIIFQLQSANEILKEKEKELKDKEKMEIKVSADEKSVKDQLNSEEKKKKSLEKVRHIFT